MRNKNKAKKTLIDVACVASVSVRFRSKEGGTRVKDRAKNGTFFGSHFISRAAKTGLSLFRNQMETLATQAIIDVNPVTSESGRHDAWSSTLRFVYENVYILRRGQDRRQERISFHGTEPGVTGVSPGRRTADILYIGVINIPGYSLWAKDVNYLLIGQVTCERTLPLSDCVLVPLVRPWSGTILLPR